MIAALALAVAFGCDESLSIRSFNVTAALWQSLDQNGNLYRCSTLYRRS